MYGAVRDDLRARLAGLEEDGLLKRELVMTTPQGSHVGVAERGALLNLCANNYLGLANFLEAVFEFGLGGGEHQSSVQLSTTLPELPDAAVAKASS